MQGGKEGVDQRIEVLVRDSGQFYQAHTLVCLAFVFDVVGATIDGDFMPALHQARA
jgi:hypothetical protein